MEETGSEFILKISLFFSIHEFKKILNLFENEAEKDKGIDVQLHAK